MTLASETDRMRPAADALPRLLPEARAGRQRQLGLAQHLAVHGPLPYRGGPRVLLRTLEDAGLTGRGGAAFPTARKLRAVADGRGRPVVVANGAEGEPAAAKDKQLLWAAPHLVLDGLQMAAEAVGARRAYLYVHRHGVLVQALETALTERAAERVDRVRVRILSAPSRFLAGEESALVNRVSGGESLPLFTPPRVFERGVDGRPTLVQNVETLAHLALVARYGAPWFRGLGTAEEPGTMLLTVHDTVGTHRVVEAALGTPVAEVLDDSGPPAQAVLVGGYHGAWLPAREAMRRRLLNADLTPLGAALGAGVLAALPADRCGVVESARVMRYLALESAGQCGPCLNGLPRIASAMTELAQPRQPTAERHGLRGHITRWSGLVQGRGACHHPDGSMRFVHSALRVFSDEYDSHAAGYCTAGSHHRFLPVPDGAPGADDWS